MLNILLYASNVIIIVSFIIYLIMIFIGKKIKISGSNSFDITKEITSKYNSINVIESKGYFSVYNIKRKVIKLSSMCYYGDDLSSITLALIEAGISIIDSNKNKYIDICRKIFSNLKILYLFPILAIFINSVTYTISDSKVSIIFVVIITFITYMLIDIKSRANEWIKDNLRRIKDVSKDNLVKIIDFINKILWLDKFIFMGEFIMIIRFMMILLEVN